MWLNFNVKYSTKLGRVVVYYSVYNDSCLTLHRPKALRRITRYLASALQRLWYRI